jgi:hypothetical protein
MVWMTWPRVRYALEPIESNHRRWDHARPRAAKVSVCSRVSHAGGSVGASRSAAVSTRLGTEDPYEVLRDGEVVASEHQRRSPATRHYTQDQAIELFRVAGFAGIHLVSGFSEQASTRADTIFSVFGTR